MSQPISKLERAQIIWEQVFRSVKAKRQTTHEVGGGQQVGAANPRLQPFPAAPHGWNPGICRH